MPSIRPISDLRNNANEISEFCHKYREPVFITKNGTGDMVVMSIEEYENQQGLLELYGKLSEAEAAPDDEYTDFFEFAEEMRKKVHGKISGPSESTG